ncbi:MAG: PhzF family phenazine biosynthesis protein [Desulfomonile tiedjei]|nr:PhzF family phenazine biosynthesis protein [Desulfomonile tiedjei]
MGRLRLYLVDVFAEEKYTGNQLAVVRGAQDLSDAEMQRIAKEMNYSETAFILSETPGDSGFDVRIFTPNEEVPFAGHPTLGTAHVIRDEIVGETAHEITLNLKVGRIPVTFGSNADDEQTCWMRQVEPTFGSTFKAGVIAPMLSLDESEIDDRFPVEEVSTGLPHIIVPLKTLESLKQACIVKDKYFELAKKAWAKAILIFSPEPHNWANDVSVRQFADWYGISEDPATGSGNGCLAGYLVRHRYWGKRKVDIRSEQGYEIGRPSLLLLKAEEHDGVIDVSVGGKAITIARGEFV